MKQINPEQLEAKIKHEEYHRIGDTMTVCSLVLHSGFVVIGQWPVSTLLNMMRL